MSVTLQVPAAAHIHLDGAPPTPAPPYPGLDRERAGEGHLARTRLLEKGPQ